MPSVLIVDDLSAIHEMLAAVIQPTGYETAFATDGEEALEKYKAEPRDVVLADISMQPMDGITLLQELKAFDPECVVIMMTGYASTETAMKALKYGAFDYIQKPFKIDELLRTLKRAIAVPRNRGRIGEAPEDVAGVQELAARIVGKSRKMHQLRQQTAKMIAGRAPLLLFGERGTGKRMIAEAIHDGGGENRGPLIVVDCALREETEFLTGLIGETGSGGDWLARAKGGTLYLQHIDKLTLASQQVLVGVVKNCTETRIVCATSVDLENLVEEGKFDDELFYRIAALPMNLPPLRDHLEDLPDLVKHFIQGAKNPSFDAGQIEFGPDALAVMDRYSWSANVAELAQVVTSLASSTENRVITADQLPAKLTNPEDWPNLEQFLAEQKAAYIRRVLYACGGDKDKAALVLGCEIAQVEQILA